MLSLTRTRGRVSWNSFASHRRQCHFVWSKVKSCKEKSRVRAVRSSTCWTFKWALVVMFHVVYSLANRYLNCFPYIVDVILMLTFTQTDKTKIAIPSVKSGQIEHHARSRQTHGMRSSLGDATTTANGEAMLRMRGERDLPTSMQDVI